MNDLFTADIEDYPLNDVEFVIYNMTSQFRPQLGDDLSSFILLALRQYARTLNADTDNLNWVMDELGLSYDTVRTFIDAILEDTK